jgi:flagellar biosynthesis protein FliR
MLIDPQIAAEAVFGFLLALARVGTALVFLPIPGYQGLANAARIVLIIGITICLFPYWPRTLGAGTNPAAVLRTVLAEASLGLVLGLAIAFLAETFQLAAQFISMQTGFSFASTFDPATQADTGVFQVLSQLISGFLFFAFGIHHQLIRMIALSFSSMHAQPSAFSATSFAAITQFGAVMMVTAFRLAMPAVALLLLTDVCLSVLSRIQAQVQLLHLAFPAKISLSLFFMSAILVRWPSVYESLARILLERVSRLLFP